MQSEAAQAAGRLCNREALQICILNLVSALQMEEALASAKQSRSQVKLRAGLTQS